MRSPVWICLLVLLGIRAPLLAHGGPFSRLVLSEETIASWGFESSTEGFASSHACEVQSHGGVLVVNGLGEDPYFLGPPIMGRRGLMVLRIRFKARGAGAGRLYWIERDDREWGEEKAVAFPVVYDGDWQEVDVAFSAASPLVRFRLDTGDGVGRFSFDTIELRHRALHPIEIVGLEVDAESVHLDVVSHADESITMDLSPHGPRRFAIKGRASARASIPRRDVAAVSTLTLTLRIESLPPLRHEVVLLRPAMKLGGPTIESESLRIVFARDGLGARIQRSGRTVAHLAPLSSKDGRALPMTGRFAKSRVTFHGPGVQELVISLNGDAINYSLRADEPVEGPVLRVIGKLDQGLLAGVEYLGRGESSSSSADIETDQRFRFEPDPFTLTMPLVAVTTERTQVSLTWRDPHVQARFSSPNRYEGTEDHRMSLIGTSIDAAVIFGATDLDAAIERAVVARGLPDLPPRTFDREAWRALCLAALDGPLKSGDKEGWGHCVEKRWARLNFVDHASTLLRLRGPEGLRAPFAPGGAHIENPSVYFLTGGAAAWLEQENNRAAVLRGRMGNDGSFRYSGPYTKGHFEDTSSGYCALRTAQLLDHARRTGNPESLAAGRRALKYLRRFKTPRGAQTWELSLHTPDILAAAHAVRAHRIAFELDGDARDLAAARSWAVRGLPFVYLWSDRPVMAYATVAVLGATNWRAPYWIGLPVQWCGIVYANELLALASHDESFPWRRVATGIARAAEAMISTQPDFMGCLPDSFELPHQQPGGPYINPCALFSLRAALDGEEVGLSVARSPRRVVVAPFPVTIDGGRAVIEAPRGTRYQIVIDGERIVDIVSKGRDVVLL